MTYINLQSLYCEETNLTELDISNNIYLGWLSASNNNIECIQTWDVEFAVNADCLAFNNACFLKIQKLIDAEINNGSKDYDKEFIKKHIERLMI